jgi:hypothetical protein
MAKIVMMVRAGAPHALIGVDGWIERAAGGNEFPGALARDVKRNSLPARAVIVVVLVVAVMAEAASAEWGGGWRWKVKLRWR